MFSRKRLGLLYVLVMGLLLFAACTSDTGANGDGNGEAAEAENDDMRGDGEMMDDHDDEDDEHMDDEDEHMDDMGHAHVDPPEEYQGLTNPLEGDSDAIAAGETIYTTNCATCHGDGGMGAGAGAANHDQAPAPIAHTCRMLGDD